MRQHWVGHCTSSSPECRKTCLEQDRGPELCDRETNVTRRFDPRCEAGHCWYARVCRRFVGNDEAVGLSQIKTLTINMDMMPLYE